MGMGNVIRELADLRQRLDNIVRVGTVTAVNESDGKVRVDFKSQDDVVSYELPVLVEQTKDNKDYYIPDIDEHVVCIFLPIGIEQGFIIGSFYSKKDKTPVTDKNKRYTKFKDGAIFYYDREEHVEYAEFPDGTIIKYDATNHKWLVDIKGDAEINTTGSAAVNISGDLTAQVGGSASATVGDMINVEAGTSATIKAPGITLDGNVTITGALSQGAGGGGNATFGGTVDAETDVTTNGISLKDHVHTEQGDGNDTSKPK